MKNKSIFLSILTLSGSFGSMHPMIRRLTIPAIASTKGCADRYSKNLTDNDPSDNEDRKFKSESEYDIRKIRHYTGIIAAFTAIEFLLNRFKN